MMFSNGTTLLCFITIFVVTQGGSCITLFWNNILYFADDLNYVVFCGFSVQSDSGPVTRFFVKPSCCQKVSNATIRGPINACFEQKENTFDNCKIHAYMWVI